MKVELHLHTSRYSACATDTPNDVMRELIDCGYGAVFITEHDAVWGDWELADLQMSFPEIRIYPGMEIALGSDKSQHLLVLGTGDRTYLQLPTAEDIILRARREGHLTVLAHPFRWPDSPPVLLAGPVYPDAIELYTCNHTGLMADMSGRAGRQLDLPVVNAGDVHALSFVNRYWIETQDDPDGPEDVRRAILARRYSNCTPSSRQAAARRTSRSADGKRRD